MSATPERPASCTARTITPRKGSCDIPIVFADVETTEVDEDRRAWEIALIRSPALPERPADRLAVGCLFGRAYERNARRGELDGTRDSGHSSSSSPAGSPRHCPGAGGFVAPAA